MKRRGLAVAVCSMLAGLGCHKAPPATNPTPRVSVERPANSATGPADWATAVYPARYERADLPEFPDEAIAAEVAQATVRADFTVRPDGRAHDVRLGLSGDVVEGRRFVDACAEALGRWRFSPAWRLTREDERTTTGVVLLPSKRI